MNTQPIEKRNIRENGALEVHSIFGPTFQGEGPFAGTPCVFVRLAGCNLQCPGCDTEYTSKRALLQPSLIVSQVLEAFGDSGDGRRLVIISGGEPFRQNLGPLLEQLIYKNCYVQIETNGSFAPTSEMEFRFGYNQDIAEREGVYVVCSPKTPTVNSKYFEIACAFKYVMSYDSVDPEDGLPIMVLDNHTPRRVARVKPPFMGEIYLQPMDHTEQMRQLPTPPEPYLPWPVAVAEENRKSIEVVKASCLKHGHILCLQVHKIIGVE